MNRQRLCKLVILYGWLDRCWNSDQHERILCMAEGGFTVHEVAIAVWLCTDGWALEEVEQRMKNYIQNSGTIMKGV